MLSLSVRRPFIKESREWVLTSSMGEEINWKRTMDMNAGLHRDQGAIGLLREG